MALWKKHICMFHLLLAFLLSCWMLLGVACWWNSTCNCSVALAWGLCCSRLESRILWSLVPSSKFSLSNSRLVKMFAHLCNPQCSVSFALSVQQCWHFQLPFPYICVNKWFYSLFFSLVLSFVRSSFGVSWIWFSSSCSGSGGPTNILTGLSSASTCSFSF